MKWKALFLTTALWLLGSSAAFAQDPPDPPVTNYTVTVVDSIIGSATHGGGTVTGGGTYASGATVTLTATAADGYTFVGWRDYGINETPREVVVTSDTTFYAIFFESGINILGSVYGGGEGSNATVGTNTSVSLYGGLVATNLYGGGALGQVNGNASVTMTGGEVGAVEYAAGTVTHTHGNLTGADDYSGHLFGGGKGSDTDSDDGRVLGNSTVTMSGGHVYFNVYGGGEMGSVGQRQITYLNNDPTSAVISTTPVANTGLATVTITGGQVGPAPNSTNNVEIALNGQDGYVFGGGKGKGNDPLDQYKLFGDVNSTSVTINIPANADITQNRIWGSVFGGAEDGHVLGDANVYYYSGLTGTQGTTSYDGNIFGGGRNYSRKNYTAGRVGGNVYITMTNGQIYGSIFGAGRLSMTGAGVNGFYQRTDGRYGAMLDGNDHGKVTINVSGGTVGNESLITQFTTHSMGDVFGGGKGHMGGIDVTGHPAESPLLVSLCKNTDVTITGSARILGSVFGGGEVGNVGNYTWEMPDATHIQNIGITSDGLAKVTVSGGTIGIDDMQMNCEIADGAGNYNLKYNYDIGHVFGGGEGVVGDPATYDIINAGTQGHNNVPLIDLMATVDTTSVTITGSAFVKGSVYGGAENGHVIGGTYVKVEGGQIGCGEGTNDAYAESAFINPLETEVTTTYALAECPHWDYDPNTNYPFDPIRIKDHNEMPSDGKTYFGNVFGGGSGYYPYVKLNTTTNQYETHWNPKSGIVEGNTKVEIEGGHILTSVYGGCEVTDVLGSATVIMSGGTLGVPRTDQQMKDHPVTCYLFGAGKGDSRVYFNQWTNVASTDVQVSGGTIYGSVFGGGEEGHVLGDAVTSISQAQNKTTIIGTSGTSYVDGNVFGGGRGFSGESLTAGVVCGDVSLTITGGTMLGSIYGGGRLASVGTYLVEASNPNYGKMRPDKTNESHGHITLEISGGTIGNDKESIYQHKAHNTGGNVFGGSMGRLELLDGTTTNPNWPYLAKVKDTDITISQTSAKGTTIKGNVYGGSELGFVTTDSNHLDTIPTASTSVTVEGGTIWGNVFGGSYGSDNTTKVADITITLPGASTATTYSVSPMKHAGNVMGNTQVNVSGGWIKKNIYGGGEFASVGFITSATEHPESGANAHPFHLSWPCEFTYATGTGEAEVNVTGGRIGITGEDFMGPWVLSSNVLVPADENGNPISYTNIDDLEDYEEDNGDIYGGGKGVAGDRFAMAYLANVKQATINIDYPATLPTGQTAATPQNFKPEDDIIVPYYNMEDWSNYTSIPCVVGAVYGGGENGHVNENTYITLDNGLVGHAVYGGGKGKDKYKNASGDKIYSYTAGKVYGNTNITVNGGNVVRSVFGGGNLASVGKGNYNKDSYAPGMGEDTTDPNLLALAKASGHTYVNIYGGTLGKLDPTHPDDVFKDTIPYGSVFGGCRGKVDVALNDPTSILSHLGFVNYTHVTIGGTAAAQSPTVLGSVYGGAQDGHVRHYTNVLVQRGEIGVEYQNATHAQTIMGNSDPGSLYWYDRGNVYGGGSGQGVYKSGSNKLHSRYAGSVMESSKVTINGGTIHRHVYGGGNMSSVGPEIVNGTDCTNEYSCDTVIINSAVGVASDVALGYGGNVFGGGRGNEDAQSDFDPEVFSGSVFTLVNINTGADVNGNVYGGGALGQVRQSTDVNINDGFVRGDVFGSGRGSLTANNYACVKVSTDVEMIGGQVFGSVYGGGQVASVGTFSDGGGGVIVCAPNTGTATVKVTGGTVGSSTLYSETDNVSVAHYYNNHSPAITDKGHVFGGGKGQSDNTHLLLCDVNNTQVTIGTTGGTNDDLRIYGSVFGGSANGHVLGNTDVTFHSGTIGQYGLSSWDGHIFGGGQGSGLEETTGTGSNAVTTFTLYKHCGRVGGNPTITMDGGMLLGSIYGGGRLGMTGVDQNGNFIDKDHGKVTIEVSGGTLGNHNNNGHDLLESDFSVGDIFGSGRGDVDNYQSVTAGCVTNSEINVSGNPTIYGSVFGGGEMACLGYKTKVGNKFVFVDGTGHADITIGGSPTIGTEYEYTIGETNNPGQWTIYNDDGTLFHTCTGNVFGGSQGDVDTKSPKWVSLGASNSAKVTINGGTIRSGVFGGPEQGTMAGDAEVVINQTDNTKPTVIGTIVNQGQSNEYLFGHVFGGGYGSDDPADNNTTVNDSTKTADMIAGRVYGDVRTKVLGGTVQGDVFGGAGLAYIGYGSSTTKGNVTLNIGDVNPLDNTDTIGSATILGNVYGANNQIGTPLGNINLNIYKTAHTDGTGGTVNNTTSGTAYAIHQVFGGGNLADYAPTPVDSRTVAATTTVHVYNCDNTIQEVYGGGNSADVGTTATSANTHLIIDGGRYDRVFGGGNGPVATSPANIYGIAYTDVYGGVIRQLFGGSNQNGSITQTNMLVAENGTCTSDIQEIYGGSNEGDIDGDVTTTVACGDGVIDYLYGGALNANITGNVTLNVYGNTIGDVFGGSWGTTREANIVGNVNLNLYGGTITNAFGGSNQKGNVAGIITVNVLDFEAANCGLDITYLYGAGNQATHNTTANNTVKNSPVVNVMHIAQADGIKRNVFGGGMGDASDLTKGAVTANPTVNIGYDANTQSSLKPANYPAESLLTNFPHAVVSGHVHGGGDLAPTTGNTTVNIRESSTLVKQDVFGGGHGSETNPNAAKVTGNTLVNMTAGTVKENIYGGGELASVCTDATNNRKLGVAKVTISGGTVGDVTATGQGPELLGDVYGGGLGRAGDAFRNWGNVDSTRVEISNTAYIVNSVFGGAEDGHVERNTCIEVTGGTIGKPITLQERMFDENGQVTTYVYTGNVLGGGRGISKDANGQYSEVTGRVYGNTYVTVSGGVVRHGVYGGGGLSTIGTYTKNTDGRFVFAEGTGKATVTINGTALIGPKASDLTGADQNNNYKYLGCNEGNVFGSGCGLPEATFNDYAFTDSTLVTIGGNAQVVGSVFGGGENGYVETEAKVVVEGNAVIGGIPLHGTATETSYNVNGGEYNGVTVNLAAADGELIEDDYGIGRTIYRGNVFGGGRGFDYINTNEYSLTAGRVYGHTHVTIQGDAQVYNRVYGGGAIASVGDFNYDNTATDSIVSVKNNSGVTQVFVKGNAIIGSDNGHNSGEVYGGGQGLVGAPGSQLIHLAYTGNSYVTVSETSQILSNVYGGSANGHVQEDAHVTINGGTIGLANQGGWHGNVYAGGGGGTRYKKANNQLHHSISAGRVFGDTYVEINSGTINNNVYGGGAFASVGSYNIYASSPSGYVIGNTGNTTVTIKGGSMHDVFGSGRGSVSDPTVYQFFDSLTYAVKTTVEIGPNNTNPTVSGSVYGSGENGHVFEKATVLVRSGTVTGSVYGAGKGTDSYDTDPTHTNPLSGVVQGNTEVNVYADATVGYNVYGGGENGQVYGMTDVHIRGAEIGTDGTDNGHVFGASKGMDNLSWNVGNANIGGSTTVTLHDGIIKGSIFGGGENGSVRFDETTVAVASTVNVEDGTVYGSVYGGGQMGFTTGNITVNMSGGEVKNHVFGGAFGAINQVYVKGLHTVNMRGGLVKGNVYGGSCNGDDAMDGFYSYAASTFTGYGGTNHVCVVNYSGGHTEHHVFGSGYRGRTYGSSFVFVGTNAIMNAPYNTFLSTDPTYNATFYNSHEDLVIDRDVWAGADYGDYDPNVNTEFGLYTVTGRSDVYIDGDGYDTYNGSSQDDDTFMILRNSVFGCGTLNDGGHQGKRILVRNYGHLVGSGTGQEPWTDATRTLHSIQYADSVIVESSHIHFEGRGIVEDFGTTEKYALYSVFNDVRLVNGSSLFIDKPIKNISNLHSNVCADVYAATPTYTEVGYADLNPTYINNPSLGTGRDNKIRINKGTYVSVTQYDAANHRFDYGALKGFMFLMTDGPYNAFAYARPKQSHETGNIISNAQLAHAYNSDGGFVSYQPSMNIYDADGYLISGGNSIQMRYENHTPNQRDYQYDQYFRVWRFKDTNAQSTFDVVLHATSVLDATGNPIVGFSNYSATLDLPAQQGSNSYYRIKNDGNVAEINYGTELKMVTVGMQESGSNPQWMYYYKDSNNVESFVYDQSEGNVPEDQRTYMHSFPNNAFGLTIIPQGGFLGGSNNNNKPWLLCKEANNPLVAGQWTNMDPSTAPQVEFLLTHSDQINGNFTWDPLSIILEQVKVEGGTEIVTDEVTVNVTITTSTRLEQTNKLNTYAIMTHPQGTGNPTDIFKARVLIPTYPLHETGNNVHSDWTLTGVEWVPAAGFNASTFVSGQPSLNSSVPHAYTKNYVGMTICPALNLDNVNGWWTANLNDPIDLGSKVGQTNISVPLGSTDAVNPISFDFDLLFDGDQKIPETDNAFMGTVKVTAHVTNYQGGDPSNNYGQDVHFEIKVYRRGKGKGFYIDGVDGNFAYSGKRPNAAQPSLAGILYFAEDYEPVDTIYVVNKITANSVSSLDWRTPFVPIRVTRYNGGHPLFVPQNATDNTPYYTGYGENPLHNVNQAYKGALIDVVTSMNISSAIINGAYEMKEMHDDPVTGSHVVDAQHVLAEAPLINILGGGALAIEGSDDQMRLCYNYNHHDNNNTSNGGAVNIASGGTLKMNRKTFVEHNYVDDGTSDYHGGGIYMADAANMLVSDSVFVQDNSRVSGSTSVVENVYISGYNTVISVGTMEATDTYGPLHADSRIGVTKIDWDNKEYMPVIYAENFAHANNLFAGNIIFDQMDKYTPYEYPERLSNGDPDRFNKLYWVKTWVSEVTSNPMAPNSFDPLNIDTPEKLAWAISIVNGLNGETAAPGTNFTITKDIDMSQYIWVPIGDGTAYTGTFEGNGHLVKGIHSPFTMTNKGMFGTVGSGANIKNLQAVVDFFKGNAEHLGGLVGSMTGGTLSNCESAGYLESGFSGVGFIGGLVGEAYANTTIHSSFAVDTLKALTGEMYLGGLVGDHKGNLYNAYSRVLLIPEVGRIDSIGGLVGYNWGMVQNCYADLGTQTFPAFAYRNHTSGKVWYSYANERTSVTYPYVRRDMSMNTTDPGIIGHGTFESVLGIKEIGYMYDDNKVNLESGQANTYVPSSMTYEDKHKIVWNGLLCVLNQWVKANPVGLDPKPTPWFRPTSNFVNADLPVLGFPMDNAMATLDADGRFLQYGATSYDANNANVGDNGLDGLLEAYKDKSSSIFLYNNAVNVEKWPVGNEKVFVNEDAVLLQASGATQDFGNTTVGITFDNSGKTSEAYGGVPLYYNWHLLSTPLQNAKMGTTYGKNSLVDGSGNYLPHDTEHDPNAVYQTSPVDIVSMEGSYFPNGLTMGANLASTDVRWDFYSYYEPEYHWINLKRNKKNHFHRDAEEDINKNLPYQLDVNYGSEYKHYQIQYDADDQADNTSGDASCVFTPGKGYMMAISQDSYLSNSGILNKDVSIPVTYTSEIPDYAADNRGTNLVGNPYQAYLDLNEVSKDEGGVSVNPGLDKFWVYDADLGVNAIGIYVPYYKDASQNTWTPSQYIHPHQGFFVVKPQSSTLTNMTFNTSMATTKTEPTSYYRARPAYPLVNLLVSSEDDGSSDLAIVEFNRPEVGGVPKINNPKNADFNLYARFDNESYGLLFTPEGTERVPVFFKTPNSGTYTLRWDTQNGTFNRMRLIDNITGTDYDMLAHDHYTFQAYNTDFAARFYIVFSVTGVDENDDDNPTLAYFNGEGWVVEGEGRLELVDMVGHVLYANNLSGERTIVHFDDFAAGMYMLRLVNSNKILKVQKIVID